MTPQLSETAPPRALGRNAAAVLAVTSAVVFMVFLDATIVNVAFETISRDLLAGAACWALASAVFAVVIGPSVQWTTHWLPPALLTGVAIGLTMPVQSGAAVATLPAARFGLGSAINASFRQLSRARWHDPASPHVKPTRPS